MKRLILGFILGLLLIPSTCFPANSWPIATKLMESAVVIENDEGICTGFVIDAQKHYLLTAAHCDGPNLLADHSPAKIVSKDVKADLLVLYVKDIDKPALKLAASQSEIGDEVAAVGFGYGLERPMFRASHISDNKAQLPDLSGTFMLVDSPFAPGQSGGPIVNHDGEVVMIVQMGNDRLGIGRGVEQIKNKVGKYFSKN